MQTSVADVKLGTQPLYIITESCMWKVTVPLSISNDVIVFVTVDDNHKPKLARKKFENLHLHFFVSTSFLPSFRQSCANVLSDQEPPLCEGVYVYGKQRPQFPIFDKWDNFATQQVNA